MKKALISILIIIVVSWAAWAAMHRSQPVANPGPAATTITQQTTTKTYSDPNGRFTFQYPSAWSVTGPQGATLAKVAVPRSYLPNTNFVEAWLTVDWSNVSSSVKNCSGTATSSEAAAGNRYDTTTTKKIYDGDCISLEYTIHYGNIQNYDPNQGVTEFDEAKLKNELDKVVQSFTWNVNSD